MRRSLVLVGAVLMIAGCTKSAPSNTTEPAEPAAEATTAAAAPVVAGPETPLGIKPGRWENTHQIVDVQAKGMPAQALAMMKGQPQTIATCVSPEQAKMGVRELMQKSGQSDCSFDKYDATGGTLATEMRCTMPQGKMTMKSTGSYTDTSYDVTGEGTTSTEAMTMTMKTHNSGRWVGECKGDEARK